MVILIIIYHETIDFFFTGGTSWGFCYRPVGDLSRVWHEPSGNPVEVGQGLSVTSVAVT